MPEIPDSFAPEFSRSQRRELWQDEVGEEVTRVAREGPLPSGDAEFDEAWSLLSEDRPEVPAEECRLRRRLIRKWFWTVSQYDK
jgi:hypothetical protein